MLQAYGIGVLGVGSSEAAMETAGSDVSNETRLRLDAYVALLGKWTRAINLVSPGDRDALWSRHVRDSLRLVPLIPDSVDRALDLGSGGGLPGLVLAIATGIPFELVEADRRKAAFLREAARVTGAPVTVRCQRIEAGGVPPARLVTARALAPLARLLGYAHPLLQPGGTCLFPKGAELEAELAACDGWRMRAERFPALDRAGSVVLRVTELSRG